MAKKDKAWSDKWEDIRKENPDHFEKIGGPIRTESTFKKQVRGIRYGKGKDE